MSNDKSNSNNALATNNVPQSPEEVVLLIRALREAIPDFALLTVDERSPLTRASAVPVEFVHAAINAIAASFALQAALGRDAGFLRGETEGTGRLTQVLDEIDAFRAGVAGAIRIRRHRLGTAAFRAFQVSIHLAKDKENANLLPHIDAMRRAAKFGKRRTVPQTEPTELVTKPK